MRFTIILAGAILIGVVGCLQNTAEQHRQAAQLVAGNAPRQAKDANSAIDQMANDLMNAPALNTGHQRTMAITDVNNRTVDPTFNYNAFSRGLASKLVQSQVALVENRAGENSDLGLNITIDELPKLTTNYYQIIATLTDLQTHKQVWVGPAYVVPTTH
jgi:uncharacterized membrane protein